MDICPPSGGPVVTCPTMTELPTKLEENGWRDDKGRFRVGHPGGPGRPRGIDLRALAEREAERENLDLEAALWRVLKQLIEAAENGCTRSAKLLFDKLTEQEATGPMVAVQTNQGPRVVNITAETRAALRDMLGDGEVQRVMLDELERRTLG